MRRRHHPISARDVGSRASARSAASSRSNGRTRTARRRWTDVTLEILNYGIGDTNDRHGAACAESDAERDHQAPAAARQLAIGGGCNYNTDATGAKDPTNWWPNVLFDTREGLLRD